MSRSLAIPSTDVPSRETTTAPIPCSASTASSSLTFVSGVTVTTRVPLPLSTSLIRICSSRRRSWCGPHGVPAGARMKTGQARYRGIQLGRAALSRDRLREPGAGGGQGADGRIAFDRAQVPAFLGAHGEQEDVVGEVLQDGGLDGVLVDPLQGGGVAPGGAV